jgi:hypothetical protein
VLADRHDQYPIVLPAYALDWIKSAILAALALSGQLSLPVVCISAVAPGVIHSFSIPPGFVLLPRYVAKEKLGPPSASAQPTLSSESSPHPQR